MPDDLSDILLWRRRRGTPSWLIRDPDTGELPALDIDAQNNRAWYLGASQPVSSLLTCSRASGGYAARLDGSLEWFGSNALRITNRGLLVEGARTNLLLRSQEFESGAWTKTLCTALDNQLIAPNGLLQGAIITDTSTSGTELAQAVTVSSGATVSVFRIVKRQSHDWVRLSIFNSSNTSGVRAWFNLSTGAAGAFNVVGGGVANERGIRALSNGWYLCWFTGSMAGETSYRFMSCSASGDATTARVDGGVRGEWGAQLEAAAFPSTYIPTGASTVTRAADNIYLGNISGLPIAAGTIIGRGTVYAPSASNQVIAAYNDAGAYGAGNGLLLRRSGTARELGGNGTSVTATMAANPATDTWAGSWSIAGTLQRVASSSGGYTSGATLDFTGVNATRLQIGANSGAGGQPFNGYIERIVMLPGLRSQSQMAALISKVAA
jgi:hypothetical protein